MLKVNKYLLLMSFIFNKLESLIYLNKFNSEKEKIKQEQPTKLESLLFLEKLKNKKLQEEIHELKQNKQKEKEEESYHIKNICKNGGILGDVIFKRDNYFYRHHYYYLDHYLGAHKGVRVDENGIPLSSEMDDHLKKFEPWEFELPK